MSVYNSMSEFYNQINFYYVSFYRCFIRRTRSRPEIAEGKQSTRGAGPEI